jgi:hypothetical protein
VGLLFAREWQLLRDAGVLTSPTPHPPPVDAGPFARAFPTLLGAATPAPVAPPGDDARVLLARRFARGDASAVATSIASLAAVFDRSVVRVTSKPPSLAKDAADAAMARRRLPADRIAVVPTALADSGVALVEVLAAP